MGTGDAFGKAHDGCDDYDGIFDTAPAVVLIVITVTNRLNALQTKATALSGSLRRVLNLILAQQLANFHIQFSGKDIRLYILSQQCKQLCCAALPLCQITMKQWLISSRSDQAVLFKARFLFAPAPRSAVPDS